MTNIDVKLGEITKEPSDALVVPRSRIIFALRCLDFPVIKVAGHIYHNQLDTGAELVAGQIIIASKQGISHGGGFEKVIFIIDHQRFALNEIIFNVLKAASQAGLKKIVIPVEIADMATETHKVGKIERHALENMVLGVKDFQEVFSGTSVEEIVFMASSDTEAVNYLHEALKRQGCTA